MARGDQDEYPPHRMAPLPRLPLLKPFEKAHTYCTFCPKMCRFACPVSVAQSRETTTPWAKMTSAHHVDRGNMELSAPIAESWYGCTGCLRCRTHCTHENEVAATLYAARAEAVQHGLAPQAAVEVLAEHDTRSANAAAAASELFAANRADGSEVLYFPGCTATTVRPDDAVAGRQAAEALCQEPVEVVADACCGLPLLEAGDPRGFATAANAWLARINRARVAVFLDPGCLHALKVEGPRHGLKVPADRMLHLSELAARYIDRIERGTATGAHRYHDPCRLGRGLGVFESPRRVLAKILGKPVEEFAQNRRDSVCAGGGGQLPRTDPKASARIAERRSEEHGWVGGGTLVTACPGSAHQLSKHGDAAVVSFASLLAAHCARRR